MPPTPKLAALLDIVNFIPTVRDRETLEAVLSEAPDAFCRFIAPNGLSADGDLYEAKERLLEVDTWRNVLESFEWVAHTEKNLTYHYRQRRENSLAIYCDEQGHVQLEENPFTEAVKEGIDAARVGKCPNDNCQRLFWKGRIDQKACSPACGKVLRTRKWREKTTEPQRQSYNKAKKKKRDKI